MRTKIQSVNDNVRLSQWKQIIQNCRESGLSVKRWCSENNISEPSYYYYLKKFRELADYFVMAQPYFRFMMYQRFTKFIPLIHSTMNHSFNSEWRSLKYNIYITPFIIGL